MLHRSTLFGSASLACLIMLAGCTLLSPYDVRAYEMMTSLQVRHQMLLEQGARATSPKLTTLERLCEEGELRFREALAYAAGSADPFRTEAFTRLHQPYRQQCDMALKSLRDADASNDGFSVGFVEQAAEEMAANFSWAIAGEKSRNQSLTTYP